MDIEAFKMGEEMKTRKIEYTLYSPNWLEHGLLNELDIASWTTIKYLNNDNTDFNNQIGQIPNNSGGLYLFSIKCPIIVGCTEYPVYIGRAQYTNHQNLRKRCREYFNNYKGNDARPLITKMIHYWGEFLYLSFLPIASNANIVRDEAALINSLLLPFNSQIPDQRIRQAIAAFQ